MPTLIDSLIVELGLDPKSFDDGARAAVRKIDDLEKKASASAAAFNRSTARGVVNLFSQLSRQSQQVGTAAQTQTRGITGLFALMGRTYQSATQHMTNAAQTARRSGQMVAAGAAQGTVSLQTLASAGLTAYASLKTVQSALLSTQDIAERTARTGRQALAAGMGGPGVQQFRATALAAQKAAGANPDVVEAELAQLQQDLNASRELGRWNERFTQIARAAPGVLSPGDRNLPPTEIVNRIAEWLQTKTPDERITWLTAQGFSREGLAHFMALPNARRQQALGEAAGRSPTGELVAEHDRLRESIVGVAQEYQNLWEIITGRFSKAGLSDFFEGMAAVISDLKKTEEGLKAIEAAVTIGFAAIVTGAVAGIAKLTRVLLGPAFLRALAPVALIIALQKLGLINLPIPHEGMTDEDRKLQGAPGRKALDDPTRATPGDIWRGFLPWNWRIFGGDPDAPRRRRLERERGGTAPLRGPVGDLSRAQDPRSKAAAIRAAAIKYGHDPDTAVRVAMAEGLLTYEGDQGRSFGAFQLFTGGGLGNEFQKEHPNIDLRDPKNEDLMIDWSMRNLARTGWGPYHGAARVGIGPREGIGTYRAGTPAATAAIPPPSRGWPFPVQRGAPGLPPPAGLQPTGGPGFPRAGGAASQGFGTGYVDRKTGEWVPTGTVKEIPPPRGGTNEWPFANLPMTMSATMDAIRSGRGWEARSGDTNTSYNRDTTIGSVIVNTQATDATGIARDIKGALDRDLTAADANMGLEY